ncbi:unnamed protein product [Angiostrongylus costaricensis]|uniref:Mediator of RNA polymerase II transcription subunit 23 n=1 Tax=Angiostrongylus costaricensis TaxID=334426 RepID=A0A158PJN0_ANGCS|nr:unnamed protein product [Angiostrongylus costaricensis]
MELVTIVHEASLQWRQEYERVVDAILYYAHSAGVLSINMCVEGLALTADFTLRTIMDPQKWTFIDENIPLMDYKGVRSLFKCLIYQQFNSIPAQLSPEQRRQLLPAERILLKILDPDLNVIPPIFTLTELSRGILKRAYMFPRLAHRLSELIMYFRAVAELSYVIGRCFLFPLPAHPSFAASAASCRIDHLTTQISHRAPYLPYKAELRAPQTYLLYMVIRQPRGKEVLSGLLRQVTHGRTQWDEILSVLISETMAEVQKLPDDVEIPRYQWENLMSIIIDDVIWTGASDHPSQLVRFLAAACMWNILDGSEGLPPPSGCLANQIEFVRSNTGPPDEAMQAVLDNAFRHESPVSRTVHAIFQQRLDGQPTEEPHILPYGRTANNKLEAFDMQFLDSLTLRAKINLLLSTCFVSLHKVDRLPSPACVETCARILTSIEFDYGLTNFIAILNRSITAALSPGPADGLNLKDQCHILLDILCYRLPSIPMNFRTSMSHSHDPSPAGLRLCMTIHSAMAQQMIRVLNMMVFHRHVMTFDRLLLSLVLHPATDHASQIAMVIVQKFPEMTFAEMAIRPPMMAEMITPRAHYPIYYGSLIERLLPVKSVLQFDLFLKAFLQPFAFCHFFISYPITFLYTILFCMHEQLGHHPRARQFVLAILCQGDQSSLTQSFINDNHQRVYSFEDLVYELADRIITCSEFILTPPPYVASDWRFAEYPPAAQALYLACIELLASPHSPEHIVPAMINLLVSSRAQPRRPYLMLNAIALLLTALPEAYCRMLQNEFLAVIDSGVLADMTFEEIVFDEFEERQLLQMASRPLIVNVVAQAYWYHSNLSSLSKLISTFAGEACSRANTENDLWYALRLVVPLLQRCYDWREKVKHEESLKVVSILYTKIGDITERYGDILHGDELCDLLYYFKYMFVGDFLRKEAEAAFPR